MVRRTVAFLASMFLIGSVAQAQIITIATQDGTQIEVVYNKKTINKTFVVLDSGDRLDYADITKISTDHFDAYERAMLRTSRKANKHVEIVFTGDANLYALQMEKLQKQRNAAHTARGAGGLLMLLGALTGDRDVMAVGAVAYGAGTIARDVNTEKTLNAQTQAIVEMQDQQKAKDYLEELEADLRRRYGHESVDGLIALIEGNHRRAMALANAGETSSDPTHQVGAVWLMAMVFADQGDKAGLETTYQQILEVDPETQSVEDAAEWLETLMADLKELRQS